jgi:NADP-dependent 3-hydroxy acid dehydrogenase YdfG
MGIGAERVRSPTSILITGASSGVGAALARRYAAPGVTLHLGGRDSARLDATARDCAAAGGRALPQRVDVTDREAMASWIVAADRAAPIALVIANAGVSVPAGIDDAAAALQAFDATMAVNLTGVANTIYPTLALMRRRGGQIAIVGSLAGWRGFPTSPEYSASKAALRALAQGLRARERADGVAIALIEPGFVATPMSDRLQTPKPFTVSAERAAAIIARRLAAGATEIAFPLPLVWLELLLLAMPRGLADRILARW